MNTQINRLFLVGILLVALAPASLPQGKYQRPAHDAGDSRSRHECSQNTPVSSHNDELSKQKTKKATDYANEANTTPVRGKSPGKWTLFGIILGVVFAGLSAIAATVQAYISHRSSRNELRAWLRMDLTNDVPPIQGFWNLAYKIENVGVTPARKVRIRSVMEAYDMPLPSNFSPSYQIAGTRASENVLLPGQHTVHRVAQQREFTEAEIADFKNAGSRRRLFVFIEASYKTIFGKTSVTTIAEYFEWRADGTIDNIRANEYNDAT